jgi:hypothetical protein
MMSEPTYLEPAKLWRPGYCQTKRMVHNAGKDAIYRLMAELYLRHAHPKDDCRDVISSDADTHEPAFDTIQYLSTHGLVVQPSLPHVVYACAQPETVSYEELRTLLRKGSQFFSLVTLV